MHNKQLIKKVSQIRVTFTMIFVFTCHVLSFVYGKWNGFTSRFRNGTGGTESAIIYMAEHIAEQGHQSIVVCVNNSIEEIVYNKVRYVNYDNFTQDVCDIIIATSTIDSLAILNKIVSYQKIFIVSHQVFCGNIIPVVNDTFQQKSHKINFLYISEFAKKETKRIVPFTNNFRDIVIGNCLNSNEVHYLPSIQKEKAFCFFACIERGLSEALAVCSSFPDFKCYLSTYYLPYTSYLQNSSQCSRLENTCRPTIYNTLAKSKYFLYSTFMLQRGIFHYDTFAYVVYEALIHGVIVITVPMDLFIELYGDAVYYIPFDRKYLNQDDYTPHPELHTYISNEFIKAIQILEESPSLQQAYIAKGRLLLNKFSQQSCVKQLFSHLHMPYQPVVYQYLFLISSDTTNWNGYVNPPSCFQTLISIAEQLENVVVCCTNNNISPIYHNNVLYVNYYSLPKTYYHSIVVLQFIPIHFISSIQHTVLRVSETLLLSYQNENPVVYHSLHQFLTYPTASLTKPYCQESQSQCVSLVFSQRISSQKILLILHSQTDHHIKEIYQLYPSHEIHLHLLDHNNVHRYKGINYCDEIHPRQYNCCFLDFYSPQGINKYNSNLFGLTLYIITYDEQWCNIVNNHPYIKFLMK